jgi:hypothetical protein
LRTGQS